jgi:tetratricopeptide (TPR) repeat protein
MAEKNAYTILNVRKDATDDELKMAHIEMVKKYDPEKHTDRFMQIQKAYKALGDPATRAKIDLEIYTPIEGEFSFAEDERFQGTLDTINNEVAQSKAHLDSNADNPEAKKAYIRTLMRRSYNHMQSKTWSEAIADWTSVLRLDNTHLRARNNILFAYIALGYQYSQHQLYDEAMDLWERALKLNPDNVAIVHNLALSAEMADETEKSHRYWGEVAKRWKAQLDDNPEDPYLKTSVIEIHKKLGDSALKGESEVKNTERAEQQYREVLSINPDDFDAQFQIAQTHMDSHSWDKALEELNKLHKKHPKNVEVLNLMGWAYLNNGEHDRAFKTWTRSLQADPKNTTTRDNIIRARLEVGKRMRERGIFMKSIVHFKELLKFLPKSPEVHYEIGMTYLGMGDRRSAVSSFNMVLKLDPKNKNAKKAISDLRLTE